MPNKNEGKCYGVPLFIYFLIQKLWCKIKKFTFGALLISLDFSLLFKGAKKVII